VRGGGGRGCAMTKDPLMGLPQSPSDKPSYRRQPRRRGGGAHCADQHASETTKPHHGGGFFVAGRRCRKCDSAESTEDHESTAAVP